MLELGAITLVSLNKGPTNTTTPRYTYNVVNVLQDQFFGEGVTIVGDKIILLKPVRAGKAYDRF